MAIKPVILGWEAAVFFTGPSTAAEAILPLFPQSLGYPNLASVANGFGIKAGRIQLNIDDQECGDSLNAQAKAQKPGRFNANVNMEFYERDDVNALGLNTTFNIKIAVTGGGSVNTGILTAELVNVYVYPNYNATVPLGLTYKLPWYFPSIVSTDYTDGWNMDGKFEGSFTGKTNGTFLGMQT